MTLVGRDVSVLAMAVDVLTASIAWKHEDVTVSSLCGLELRKPSGIWSLRTLGIALNWLQPNHCENAIAADIARATRALALLRPTLVVSERVL